jgi:hypothetical protein
MSQIRLYIDEDATQKSVIAGLLRQGVDVLTVADVKLFALDDEQQLEWSTSNGRVIYTLNAEDFARLHSEFIATGRSHGGILTFPKQRHSVGEKIRRIKKLIDSISAEEMVDRMEYL